MNPRDLELLSVYLDGQLNPSDSARLESRLASDEGLRTALDDLRSTRSLLRQLPSRRAPRNFTLTPQMAGIKPPTPRVVPVFRFATALATFLFVISFVINGLISLSAPSYATAQMPSAVGAAAPMAAAQEAAPAATQAPALPFAPIAPTEASSPRLMSAAPMTTEVPMSSGAGLAPKTTETSTPEIIAKSIPPQVEHGQPIHTQNESSVPFDFEIFFGILALGFGITTWILPRNNERSFRKKWDKKRN
jgi:anti-sigma factor RsiW